MPFTDRSAEIDAEHAVETLHGIAFPQRRYAYVFVGGQDTPCPVPYVVLPDGESLSLGGHADLEIRTRRAEFIAAAINERLGLLNADRGGPGKPRGEAPSGGYYPKA